MNDFSHLPPAEFAFPGPLRDKLVAAILAGEKTSTTGLLADYQAAGDPLPTVGDRQVVLDSAMRPVAVIEITEVRTLPLRDVDWPHVRDEGEGDDSVASWRTAHEQFWHSPEMRNALGDPDFTVNDNTLIVAERFRVVDRLER